MDENNNIRLEAFTATELNKIFSGNKPCDPTDPKFRCDTPSEWF
jgi:hypothetical protein